MLDRGIVVGPEHHAGRYRVYGVFSRAPFGRDAIRGAFDEVRLTAGPDTAVVVTELVVR